MSTFKIPTKLKIAMLGNELEHENYDNRPLTFSYNHNDNLNSTTLIVFITIRQKIVLMIINSVAIGQPALEFGRCLDDIAIHYDRNYR